MKPKVKHIRISFWNLFVSAAFLYVLFVLLGFYYLSSETNKSTRSKVFSPSIGLEGIQLYSQQCPPVKGPFYSMPSNVITNKTNSEWKYQTCLKFIQPLKADIEVEKLWPSISVAYPKYVYTVSGWSETIQVPSYNAKPLRVIIIPHSHHDVGWKDTVDSYFYSHTRHFFDNLVYYLDQNPTWKFIWPEIIYLDKWFNMPESNREKFKKLVLNGQLEIVTGGWVMTDEAVAHFTSMLDQLIEGHLWLHQNLGIVPKTSWSVDPFGHSPTMAYLLKKAGIDRMVIQRTHFAIKRHFAKLQNLEFVWRQTWDSNGKTGVLCHMMPFLLYAIQYSCGPDPHVCCQFDFYREKCFQGLKSAPTITVDESNINKLSWTLWEQFQKKAQLYRSNTLLVPHGDDFRYTSSEEWLKQFDNLGKLMEYMNKNEDMNIQVEFGTVLDYFAALEEDSQKQDLYFPSLTGDFFPYNDRAEDYWTGYYSVRPLYKYMARVLQSKLRITEILFSLTIAQSWNKTSIYHRKYAYLLVDARRDLALFQHHDAITGTSVKLVVADYAKTLQKAYDELNFLLMLSMLNSLMLDDRGDNYVHLPPDASMAEEWILSSSPPTLRVSSFNSSWYVVVANPLTIPWTSAITVQTSTPCLVREKGGDFVASQTNPVINQEMIPVSGVYDIVFVADLPALSVKTFQMVEDTHQTSLAVITIFGGKLSAELFMPEFKTSLSKDSVIEIRGSLLKASLSPCTGTLQHILRKVDQKRHKTEVKMVSYTTGSTINPFKDKSGAYIFMPDGPAKNLDYFDPTIVVIKGSVMSSVISALPGVLHTTILYNISGPVGAGVHINNIVDLSSDKWNNGELAMRITTDVLSPDTSLCVDQNGFQMQKKKWKSKLLIQGNFHPVTSMAYMTNRNSRMTLVTAESHGIASLERGVMDVILERKLMQDDWRGMGEGPHEAFLSPSKFILIPERRNIPLRVTEELCYPSLLSHLLSTHLNNPPQVALFSNLEKDSMNEIRFLKHPWPCSYNLLNFRNLGVNSTNFKALLILHKVGLDCKYHEAYMDCNVHDSPSLLTSFSNSKIQSAVETTITGVSEVTLLENSNTELQDMEIKTIKVTI